MLAQLSAWRVRAQHFEQRGRPLTLAEAVVAFVVARPGVSITEATFDAHCLAHGARFRRPKHNVFVDAHLKHHCRKVLKTALRESLLGKAWPAAKKYDSERSRGWSGRPAWRASAAQRSTARDGRDALGNPRPNPAIPGTVVDGLRCATQPTVIQIYLHSWGSVRATSRRFMQAHGALRDRYHEPP